MNLSQAENISATEWTLGGARVRGSAMDALNLKRMNKGRNFVREWRKHRKMTQERLAELTGYTASSISQLETGVQGSDEATLVKLSAALVCRPSAGFGDAWRGAGEELGSADETTLHRDDATTLAVILEKSM